MFVGVLDNPHLQPIIYWGHLSTQGNGILTKVLIFYIKKKMANNQL